MAAPSPTTRGTPAGIKLKDGYKTLVTCALNSTICLWEKGAKPPGIDGGDPINQTTMHNADYRTMAARALKTLTESSFKAAYDPVIYSYLIGVINVETTITYTFKDGSTIAFYGYFKSIEFDELVEGTQPECTVSIVPTNWDPVNKVEAGPAISSVTGS